MLGPELPRDATGRFGRHPGRAEQEAVERDSTPARADAAFESVLHARLVLGGQRREAAQSRQRERRVFGEARVSATEKRDCFARASSLARAEEPAHEREALGVLVQQAARAAPDAQLAVAR